jgi:GT2 family glycosyltransferase
MAETAPRVSVIIPHLAALSDLDECLSALERQTLARDAFEVIVSDNGSPEGLVAVADAIAGRARLVSAAERGPGPARNAAVSAARGARLAFTDCDCKPHPEWLVEGLRALESYDIVGGRILVSVADPIRITEAEAFERVFAFNNEAYVKQKGFTATANMFCARGVFDQIGGFPPGLMEDLDWCHRATAAGFRLGYVDGAVVSHPARRSWEELKRKWRGMIRTHFDRMASRRWGRMMWCARSLLLPFSAVIDSPKVILCRELGSSRQKLQALAGLYRHRLWRFAESTRLIFDPMGQ